MATHDRKDFTSAADPIRSGCRQLGQPCHVADRPHGSLVGSPVDQLVHAWQREVPVGLGAQHGRRTSGPNLDPGCTPTPVRGGPSSS